MVLGSTMGTQKAVWIYSLFSPTFIIFLQLAHHQYFFIFTSPFLTSSRFPILYISIYYFLLLRALHGARQLVRFTTRVQINNLGHFGSLTLLANGSAKSPTLAISDKLRRWDFFKSCTLPSISPHDPWVHPPKRESKRYSLGIFIGYVLHRNRTPTPTDPEASKTI